MGFDYGSARTLLALGRTQASRGNDEGAANHYAGSLRLWMKVKNTEGLAETLAATASLASKVKQPEIAVRLLGAATALLEPLGYLPHPRSGKRQKDVAAAILASLGARRFNSEWEIGRGMTSGEAATEAAALLDRIAWNRGETDAVPDLACVLTPREQAVLRLLVEGLADREIAQQLDISYRSVTSYVRNILTKCNVQSRTAVATHALRRGLV